MSKSESTGAGRRSKPASRRATKLTASQRIDPPHEIQQEPAAESSAATPATVPEPVDPQVRAQADQLAGYLRNRQRELDHRESQINSQLAQLESETRSARLWLEQRETELNARHDELSKQQDARERQLASRETRLSAAEATFRKKAKLTPSEQEAETQQFLETLATRQQQIEEAEARLAEAQEETRKLHEQISEERRAMDRQRTADRERWAAEQSAAMADLERKRQAVQRRADQVDQCENALKQLRAELESMHRETLEIRLATEELWARMSGDAPPAALTQSLSRLRAKLAEQYSLANAELVRQKKELETIRGDLGRQYETLVAQKCSIEQWVAGRQEECQQQAERLVAREQQLLDEETQYRQQTQRWQVERLNYQQELRRLRAELSQRDEPVSA
ncbi:MAG: hypothetical protein LLF97_06940 [Planctomycetaceae bacterium]|nr:hypothetical protein [Planctomycetaceae bacterium]